MDRIHTFIGRAKTVAMAVVLFITASADAMRKLPVPDQQYGLGDFIAQIFIALLGALSIVLFEQVVNWAIGKYRALRRLIMGRQDIEGYWLETVRSHPAGEIVGFAVESINYADDDFFIDGKQFDTQGRYTGSYWTVIHEYADNQSKLVFGSKHVGDSGPEKSGYSLVHYLRPDHQITGYVGYYTDTDITGRLDITGQRLTTSDEVELARSILTIDLMPESSEIVLHLYRLKSQKLQHALRSLTGGSASRELQESMGSPDGQSTVIEPSRDLADGNNAASGANGEYANPTESSNSGA